MRCFLSSARPLPLFLIGWQTTKRDLFASRTREKGGCRNERDRKIYEYSSDIATGRNAGCAGGPLTTREKGAGIGALGGAAAGGLIGSAVGHPGAGAAIGGGLGLGAGALIGDQLQGQEYQNYRQDQQIRRNNAELERQRYEVERLRRQRGEY
jgi:phage tail tape-measure protein